MPNSEFVSPYSPHTKNDRRKMLDAIGVASADDLFQDIPLEHRDPTLKLPDPKSEFDLRRAPREAAGQLATVQRR